MFGLVFIVPPVRVIVLVDAVVFHTPPPQPVPPLVPSGIVRPAGSVAVRFTPVAGSGFAAGFVTVNVSVDVPLRAIVVGL